jgi:hydrogenase maturation protein HypF
VLGVSWDGTGFGTDGTIWGGEFLLTNETLFERVATFRTFPLPGGEKAIKEPRRTALGLLCEMIGEKLFESNLFSFLDQFEKEELELLQTMLTKNINSPRTSSVGRLFDAVASLLDIRQKVNFEGQAAMELEFLTHGVKTDERYPFEVANKLKVQSEKLKVMNMKLETQNSLLTTHHSPLTINWEQMIENFLTDIEKKVSPAIISTKFHNTLTEIIIEIAKRTGEERVVLSGGCFQNKYLTERTVTRLREERFRPYWHQRVPTNDGGIALGQIFAAVRMRRTQNLQPQEQLEETLV